jgi:hypothetical protein
MRATLLQTNFTAGEVSPRIYARPDISRYQNAAKVIENCLCTVHGGAYGRGGFRFVKAAKLALSKARLIPFVFSRDQAYMLEFGDYYMRVFKNRGQVFSGSSAYEIPTPYSADMLPDVDFCQGRDTMFMFHPDVPIHRLRRFDHDYWDLSPAPFLVEPFAEIGLRQAIPVTLSNTAVGTGRTLTTAFGSPFLAADVGRNVTCDAGLFIITAFSAVNSVTGDVIIPFETNVLSAGTWVLEGSPQTTITPSVATPEGATVTLTASASAWRSADVGKFVELNGGLVEITVFTDATHVNGTILKELSAVVGAPADAWTLCSNIWNSVDGYPRTGTLYQQRLCVAGSPGYPQRYIMSVVGEVLNFTLGTLDTDGFAYDIESDEANPIAFMCSIRTLLALTYGGEFTIDGGVEKPITPTNPQVRPRSGLGCAQVRPVKIKSEELFVQRSGRTIQALSYNTANDDYLSPDLTVLSEHITESGVCEMAYQQRPNSTLWAVRNDGQVATLALERDQEVAAWSRQVTDGQFESAASIPGEDGDELWVIVKRIINGVTKRYVEIYDESILLDCSISGEGVASAIWVGLDHVEAKEVAVVAEGCYFGTFTVTGGQITLPRAVTDVQIGLPYTPTIELLDPEVPSGEGSAQNNPMFSNNIGVRLLESYGVHVNGTQLFPIGDLNLPPEAFSGTKDVSVTGWHKGSSPVTIEQRIPMPFHCLGIVRKFTVNQQ